MVDHAAGVNQRGHEKSLDVETPAVGELREGWFLSVQENPPTRADLPGVPEFGRLLDKIPVAARTLASITLGRQDKDGEHQKAVYRLDGEGIVRRRDKRNVVEEARMRDYDDSYATLLGRQAIDKVVQGVEPVEAEKGYVEESLERKTRETELGSANRVMEREMRLNEFPVDPSELAALKEWIAQQPFGPRDLRPGRFRFTPG